MMKEEAEEDGDNEDGENDIRDDDDGNGIGS